MEFLKKMAEGGRQHYEKVILTLALVGLGLAVWFLYQDSLKEEAKIADFFKGVERKGAKPVPKLDLTRTEAALKLASNSPSLNLGGGHYLFNPVTWQIKPDGTLVKIATGAEIGPSVMVARQIRPLNVTIALERPALAGTAPDITVTGYHMVWTNEAARPGRSKRQVHFANLNVTNRTDVFILREIVGPPEAPTELTVELRDTGERVKVLPGQPFVRTVAYEADLYYPVTNKTFSNKRKDGTVLLAGDSYKISDITADMVTLSDESNQKTYNVPLAPAPPK